MNDERWFEYGKLILLWEYFKVRMVEIFVGCEKYKC